MAIPRCFPGLMAFQILFTTDDERELYYCHTQPDTIDGSLFKKTNFYTEVVRTDNGLASVDINPDPFFDDLEVQKVKIVGADPDFCKSLQGWKLREAIEYLETIAKATLLGEAYVCTDLWRHYDFQDLLDAAQRL